MKNCWGVNSNSTEVEDELFPLLTKTDDCENVPVWNSGMFVKIQNKKIFSVTRYMTQPQMCTWTYLWCFSIMFCSSIILMGNLHFCQGNIFTQYLNFNSRIKVWVPFYNTAVNLHTVNYDVRLNYVSVYYNINILLALGCTCRIWKPG